MIRLTLSEGMFADRERTLFSSGAFQISAFRYPSGVAALRVVSPRISMITLPFVGQIVWNLVVDGEDLTMTSAFPEPTGETELGLDYGMFMLHCGLTGMGNPTDEDSHPLHGELPHAAYEDAYVEILDAGEEEKLVLGGVYRHRRSIEFNYTFEPRLVISSDSPVVELASTVTNHRHWPLDYQYMCHLNWQTWENARFVQTNPLTPDRYHILPDPSCDPETVAYVDELVKDPQRSTVIEPGRLINPEYCVWMEPYGDSDKWAHFLQVRPDGKACYVGWDTSVLPNCVRWITRTVDENVAGFALPATGHHLGNAQSRRDGMVRVLPPQSSVVFSVRFGFLGEDEATEMEQSINNVLEGR